MWNSCGAASRVCKAGRRVAKESSEKNYCGQSASTAAYLDGELDAAEASHFEQHTKRCASCAATLIEQRRLLCLLDNAFGEAHENIVALPKNFARVVTARAQSDMRGIRHGLERKRALTLCVMLTAATFVLLGASMFDAVIGPVIAVVRALTSVLWIIGYACADACAGVIVILRAVGGSLIAEPNPLGLLQWMLFAGAIILLLHLIARYHRRAARISE